jgi:hypothetical protein
VSVGHGDDCSGQYPSAGWVRSMSVRGEHCHDGTERLISVDESMVPLLAFSTRVFGSAILRKMLSQAVEAAIVAADPVSAFVDTIAEEFRTLISPVESAVAYHASCCVWRRGTRIGRSGTSGHRRGCALRSWVGSPGFLGSRLAGAFAGCWLVSVLHYTTPLLVRGGPSPRRRGLTAVL